MFSSAIQLVSAFSLAGLTSEPPKESVALIGATLHTLEPGVEPRQVTLLIEGERIVRIETELELEPGTLRYDWTGKHLVPGLIDGMVSFDPEHDALYLASGITLVRDMGGDASVTNMLRAPEFRDATPGPSLLTAGAVLDGEPALSASAVVVRDEAGLIGAVERLNDAFDVDFLSVQPNFQGTLVPPLVELAKAFELQVWGLVPRDSDFKTCIEAGWFGFLGLDVLLPKDVQWTFAQAGAFEAHTALLLEHGAALVPVVGEASRRLRPGDPDSADFRLLNFFYQGQWMSEWHAREALFDERFKQTGERMHKKRSELLKRLMDQKVKLLPGSGAPLSWVMPGRSLLDELDAWVAAGVTPYETLRAATRGAAEILGLAPERGHLALGSIADLVLLDVDPRLSLEGLRQPRAVIVRGRVLERADLDDLLTTLERDQQVVREEESKPLPVPEIELPEGSPVLSGMLETRSLGMRLSAERFALVLAPNGDLLILGRMFMPGSASFAPKELEVAQRFKNGYLDGFSLRLVSGPDELVLRGIWQADSLRMERKRNGAIFATQSTNERPVLITLSPVTDSITAAFALSQHRQPGDWVVLDIGPELEPVLDRWKVQDESDGSRWIKNQQGLMQFVFEPNGAPRYVYRKSGVQETYSVPMANSVTTYGGPGLPSLIPPADSAALIGPAASDPAGDGTPDKAVPTADQGYPKTPLIPPAEAPPAEPLLPPEH